MDEQYGDWCRGGTWFRETICQNIHGPLFNDFFVTTGEGRYDLICRLYAYNQRK